MSLMKEFKEFAVRGSVVDLAVGIVIGGAFGKIVSSFVSDVLMPPIGLLVGGIHFSALAVTLKKAAGDAPAVLLKYGSFVESVVDFTIVAFAIFMVIKAINRMKRQKTEAPGPPPAPSREVELLSEIRDSLKSGR